MNFGWIVKLIIVYRQKGSELRYTKIGILVHFRCTSPLSIYRLLVKHVNRPRTESYNIDNIILIIERTLKLMLLSHFTKQFLQLINWFAGIFQSRDAGHCRGDFRCLSWRSDIFIFVYNGGQNGSILSSSCFLLPVWRRGSGRQHFFQSGLNFSCKVFLNSVY